MAVGNVRRIVGIAERRDHNNNMRLSVVAKFVLLSAGGAVDDGIREHKISQSVVSMVNRRKLWGHVK